MSRPRLGVIRNLSGPGHRLPASTPSLWFPHHTTASRQVGAHTDRSIRTPASGLLRFNTAGRRAAAPPAGGTPPATGPTTAADRRSDRLSGRSGTAAGSAPRRRSRTPSAAATAFPHDASPPTGGAPAPAALPTPSGSRP